MGATAQNLVLPFSKFNNLFIKKSKSAKKTKKILIVEDDADMSYIICRSLKAQYNCQVEAAQDAFEAMNMMADNFYDLIILDWHVPGLSGADIMVEVEKALKFDPMAPSHWDTKKTEVVVFSSSKKSECLPRKTRHFNFVGFISKTQPLVDIIDLFGEYITGQRKEENRFLKLQN